MCCFKVTVVKSSTQFIVGNNYLGILVNSFKFKFMLSKTMAGKYTLNWKLINFPGIRVPLFFSNIDTFSNPLTISNQFQSSSEDVHSFATAQKISQTSLAGKNGQSWPVTWNISSSLLTLTPPTYAQHVFIYLSNPSKAIGFLLYYRLITKVSNNPCLKKVLYNTPNSHPQHYSHNKKLKWSNHYTTLNYFSQNTPS